MSLGGWGHYRVLTGMFRKIEELDTPFDAKLATAAGCVVYCGGCIICSLAECEIIISQ